MTADEIETAVSDYLNLIEKGEENEDANIRALEEILDRLALAWHHIEPVSEEGHADPPRKSYDQLRSAAADQFPSFGYYNIPDRVTNKIAQSDIIVGDAIDDLADIARDLHDVSWRFEETSTEDALCDYHLKYRLHWREHLRNLQFYLEALRNE